jgi:hypothetical protein
MDAIWDESWRVLDARRTDYVDAARIKEHLRSGDGALLVANVGSDLGRLSGNDAYEFWKNEASVRLVPPRVAESGFSLDDYPGGYCYLASLWTDSESGLSVILFEKYH